MIPVVLPTPAYFLAPDFHFSLSRSPVVGWPLSLSLGCCSQVLHGPFEWPQADLPSKSVYPRWVFDRKRAQPSGRIPIELSTVSLKLPLECPYTILEHRCPESSGIPTLNRRP